MRAFLFAAFLALLSVPGFAAGPAPFPTTTVCQTSGVLAVTAASANVVLPCSVPSYPAVLIINDGLVEAFFAYGNSGVTAATTNVPLPAGGSIAIWIGTATHIAAITASSTTTLRLVQANGGL